jgi:sulfoxide reductase heme-binding subunit YedZ
MKHLAHSTICHIKRILWCLCLIPVLRLSIGALTDDLGADPIEAITRSTGRWALNLLLVSLAITPLRRLSGWQWLVRLRRTLSLFAFFYASLHFLAYLAFDQSFDGAEIVKDVSKRPFIAVGFVCFLLLIPLALTSTDGMIRRLGGRRWQRLHRLVYLIAMGAVFHYLWLVKRDITAPAWYAVALGMLFLARLWKPVRPKNPGPAAPAGAALPPPGADGRKSWRAARNP